MEPRTKDVAYADSTSKDQNWF